MSESESKAVAAFVKDAERRNAGYWLSWRRCAVCGYLECTVARAGSSYEDWKRFVEIEIGLLGGWNDCAFCGAYTRQECIGLSRRPQDTEAAPAKPKEGE